MGEIMLALAVIFTVGHVVCDAKRLRHIHEMIPMLFLLGHVIFTGEILRWVTIGGLIP